MLELHLTPYEGASLSTLIADVLETPKLVEMLKERFGIRSIEALHAIETKLAETGRWSYSPGIAFEV